LKSSAANATQGLENIAYVLGSLTAGGGTIGFLKSGSVPSIAAGWTVGLLCMCRLPLPPIMFRIATKADKPRPCADGLGGYRLQNGEPYGLELALLASVVLGGSSIPRALRGRKPVPSALSLLSLFGLFMFGDAYRQTL
jgi:uncharacterized membrane protein (UPF0136 family)